MKKQIILYIIQTIIPIETIFMLMVAFICQSAKDFSKYWLILLSFQIPIVCMVVLSTIAYYESYLNETEKWREQLKKMKQEWESNPEFIGCLIEVEKENGTMKKYIKVEAELIPNGVKIYPNNVEASFLDFVGAKVLAEADTIEELCDRFVSETEDNTKFWVEPTLENAKMYCGIKNIFGAIWTDKGLIYVAKMNDEGVLELI